MTTPDDRKTLKVSPVIHARIMDLAAELGGSAEDALSHLLGETALRVPVSPVQLARWTSVARSLGTPVTEFVRTRVESTLLAPQNDETMKQIFYRIDIIMKHFGISARPKSTRRQGVPKASTD
jgi:hypothetical protein